MVTMRRVGAGADGDAGPVFGLSARQMQILGALARGEEPRALARRLGISAYTVATHTERAYAVLGLTGVQHQRGRQAAYVFGVLDAGGLAAAERVLAVFQAQAAARRAS